MDFNQIWCILSFVLRNHIYANIEKFEIWTCWTREPQAQAMYTVHQEVWDEILSEKIS